MNDNKVLEKALDIAMANGWLYDGRLPVGWYNVPSASGFVSVGHDNSTYPELSNSDLLFDPHFARALWGENRLYDEDGTPTVSELTPSHDRAWQYYLQQLAVAPDRIAYLRENLPEEKIGER